MKSKTNISVRNNLGQRVSVNMEVGQSNGYASGDILNANATKNLIESVAGDIASNTTDVAIINATTSKPFPESWPTNTTLAALCSAVVSDKNATVGQTYLGGVSCSGLPTGMANGELKIEIINALSGKLLVLTIVSTNLFPYHWEAIYYSGQFKGIEGEPWRGYLPLSTFNSFLSALGTQMGGTWSFNSESNSFTFTEDSNQETVEE